jgi:hypothetical protein
MASAESTKWSSFPEIPLAFPEGDQRLSTTDFSGSGMQTAPSQSPTSSASPCCLSECVEIPLVYLTTYLIRESRASLNVPFLDGIFHPPKTA